MAPEVRFTPYGIPYVVEFANVSIWPRPPVFSDPEYSAPIAPLTRSNTMPSLRTHKPLPSLPHPTRSASLKIFRSKANDADSIQRCLEDTARPVYRRNATTPSGEKESYRHAKVYSTSSSHSLFSGSQTTLVAPPEEIITPESESGQPAGDLSTRFGGLYVQFIDSASTSAPMSSLPPSSLQSEGTTEAPRKSAVKISRTRLQRLSRTIAEAVLAAGMDTPSKVVRRQGDAEIAAVDREQSRGKGDGGEKALFRGTYGQVRAAFRAAGLVTTPCQEQGPADGTSLQFIFSHVTVS